MEPTTGWRVWGVDRRYDEPRLTAMFGVHLEWPARRVFVADPLIRGWGHVTRFGVFAWERRDDAIRYVRNHAGGSPAWGTGAEPTVFLLGQVALYGPVTRCVDSVERPTHDSVELAAAAGYPVSFDGVASLAPLADAEGDELVSALRAAYLGWTPTPTDVDTAVSEWRSNAAVDALTPIARAIPRLPRLLEAAHAGGCARSPIHGDVHWRNVAVNGGYLINAGAEANPAVVYAFAVLHDARRVNEGDDPGHGPRAALLADELRADGVLRLTADEHAQLCHALTIHTGSRPVDDATIGVCLDADRLDLVRLGARIDPRHLSTRQARRRVVPPGSYGLVYTPPTTNPRPPSWHMLRVAYGGAVTDFGISCVLVGTADRTPSAVVTSRLG